MVISPVFSGRADDVVARGVSGKVRVSLCFELLINVRVF